MTLIISISNAPVLWSYWSDFNLGVMVLII